MKNAWFFGKTKDKHFMCLKVIFMVRQKEWFKGVLCEDKRTEIAGSVFLTSKEYMVVF